jgi:20S proteasome alpha/beta subunit
MVTHSGFMEHEHPGSKMVQLTERAILAVAGNTLDGMRIANEASAAMAASGTSTAAAMASDLGDRYKQARLSRAEQFVLGVRGLSLQAYYQMHQGLNGQVVMLLDNQLAQFDLGVDLLLAAVDDTGAHIHTNGNPGGGNSNHDPIGYAAIGSGAIHVVPAMAGFTHSGDASYDQTLFHVYAAKRRAQVAPGVGTKTEMAVLTKGGIKHLSRDELKRLGDIYDEFMSVTDAELEKQLADFHLEADTGSPDGAAPAAAAAAAGEGNGRATEALAVQEEEK